MIQSLSSNTAGSYIYETIKTKIDSIDSGTKTASEQKAAQASGQEEFQTFPKEKMETVVEGLNKFLKHSNTALKFQYHEKLQEYYVTLVDEKTQEVVREIPPKKMLDFYAAMTEFLGLIVDKKI